MLSKKYNPFVNNKGKKNNVLKLKKIDKNNKNAITNISINLVKIILYLILLIILIISSRYIYDKIFYTEPTILNPNPTKAFKLFPKKDFDEQIIPSGNTLIEKFDAVDAGAGAGTGAGTGATGAGTGAGVETTTAITEPPKFITNSEIENKFFSLDPGEQSKLCMNKADKVVGYKNAISGAVFRFQKVDPLTDDENADYFLLGSIDNGKVIQLDDKGNLQLKEKSSTENKQHFKRKLINNVYYFTPSKDNLLNANNVAFPIRALQYEFEHLSLRQTRTDGPFEGQKFLLMSDEEQLNINTNAVSYGIGIAHLDNDDIKKNNPINYVFLNSDGSTVTENLPDLVNNSNSNESDANLNNAVDRILVAFDEYKKQNNTSNSVLGNDPLKINLNLFDGDTQDNFTNIGNNISNLESFQNLKGSETNDVRSKLNKYFNNNTQINIGNTNKDNTLINKMKLAASGTSFRGCPVVDNSEYINKRHLAKCYGCNPDSSLQ